VTRSKKSIIVMAILLSIITTFNFSALAASKRLCVQIEGQEKSLWCWAATAVMSGHYYYNYKTGSTSNRSQSDVVLYVKGNTLNQGATIAETSTAMGYAAMNHSDCQSNYSTMTYQYSTLKGFINLNKPIIATGINYDGSGHAIIIEGYKDGTESIYNEIDCIDPANGGEARRVYYSEFLANGQGFFDYWFGIVYWS
jgi:hypothetical protein